MARPIVALEVGGVAVGLRELPDGEVLDWDAPLLAPSGTRAAPGVAFEAEPGTGWYRAGAGDIRFAIGDADVVTITAAGIAWASLTGLPATWAPSAHGHPASEVTAGTFAAGTYSFAGSTINGQPTWGSTQAMSISGTATLASTVTVVDSTSATCSVALFDAATGSLAAKTDAGLTYAATTGILTATGFAGALNGSVGAGTPAAGAFTTLSASGLFSGRAAVLSCGGYTLAGAPEALSIGASLEAYTRGNETAKVGVITTPHYLAAEPGVVVISAYTPVDGNIIEIGGGLSSYNAATLIRFFTGATTTTKTGTLALTLASTGAATFAGAIAVSGIASFAAGAVDAPSIARTGDLHTGLWFPADNTIAASVNGVEGLRLNTTGFGVGITPAYRLHVKDASSGFLFADVAGAAWLAIDGSNGDFVGGDYWIFKQDTASVLTLNLGGSTDICVWGANGMGVGVAPVANANLTLLKSLALKETTTPTADADYGKVYTKSDNKLYFQDGGGTEHEVALVA